MLVALVSEETASEKCNNRKHPNLRLDWIIICDLTA